jgi:tetratricopeptide (TPR) repeat protein
VEKHLSEVRVAPQSGAAWGKLGAVLRSFEFRDEARRCFETAERLDPKEPRWPYLHSLLLASDSPSAAVVRLHRAVALCGNEPDTPRLRLARLLAEAGQWDEARSQLRELLRAKPDHAPALLALAHAAQARGDLAEAVSLANRCTSDRRTSRAASTLLGILHQRLGDTNAARSASQRAAALPPDAPMPDRFEMEATALRIDPRVLSDRSQRLLQSGRLAEAAPLITQLVRDHPQFSEGWLLLGRLQVQSKDPVAAEQSLRRHLEMDRSSVNGLFQLGMALLAQERNADAAEIFEQATKLKSDFGPAYFNLGLAMVRSGRRREAVTPFREAIRHNPERIDSYILLADLFLQLGEKTEAAELARQAQAVNPEDWRLPALREKIGRVKIDP